MTLEIRLAADSDYDALYSLFKGNDFIDADLDSPLFGARCHWQYVENPPGIRYQWVADDSGRIVAHYAMIPAPFIRDGQAVIAGIGSNLVIDESHRNGMLFLKMQKNFLRRYPDFGIDFTYSLVTRTDALTIHLRTGFTSVGRLPVLIRPFKLSGIFNHFVENAALRALMRHPLKLIEFFLKFRYTSSSPAIEVTPVPQFDSSIDPFLRNFSDQYDYVATRNASVLNWRFTAYAQRRYEIHYALREDQIAGYMVTRRMAMKNINTLAIVDLICLKRDVQVQKALLAKAHELAVRYEVDVCATLQNPCLDLAKTMHRHGYLNSPESFTLCTHQTKAEHTKLDGATFPRWFVSWFDNDYV